ncbi:MAG: hypothetical protein F2804_05480, partial [Actinobacteria bacterium]|nr:hypothetical protein [Actinomycetota bacterium]
MWRAASPPCTPRAGTRYGRHYFYARHRDSGESVMSFPYLPIEDAVSAAFWEGTRIQELLLQSCNLCSKYQHYPRALCSHCGGTDLEWQKVSGQGIID